MATNNKKLGSGSESKGGEIQKSAPGILTERPDFLKKGGTRGRENVTTEDITLPRLEIAQALSPAVQPNKPEYVEGLKVGDLYNSVTKQIYPRPVTFVPVFFRKEFNVWKKRIHGGGFGGSFPTQAEAIAALDAQVSDPKEQEKYEILDTPVFFGLVIDGNENIQRISVTMAKTKAKHARRLNTLIDLTHEDAFNRVYALGSVDDKNKMGQEFKNFTIDQLGYPNEAIVEAAESFYALIKSGKANFRVDTTGPAEDEPAGSTEY